MLKNVYILFFLLLPIAAHAQDKEISFEAFGKKTTLNACIELESGYLEYHDLRCGTYFGEPLVEYLVHVYFKEPKKCAEFYKFVDDKNEYQSWRLMNSYNKIGLRAELYEVTSFGQDEKEKDFIGYYAVAYDTELCVGMINQELSAINEFFNLYK